MQVKAKAIRSATTDTGDHELTLTLTGPVDTTKWREILDSGKLLTVEIKPERRSLDANALCWVLCTKIANSIRQTPENVYRAFIKRVGQSDYLLIQNEAVDAFIANWASKGEGWFAEKAWESKKVPDCTTVKVYYGSSIYDTKQMSILLDEIVTECKEMGIETMTPHEIESLKSQWEGK